MAKRSSSKFWPRLVLATCLAAMIAPDFVTQALAQDAPAKQAFGSKQLPVLARSPQSIGFYAKGCLSGGVALLSMAPTGRSCGFLAIATGAPAHHWPSGETIPRRRKRRLARPSGWRHFAASRRPYAHWSRLAPSWAGRGYMAYTNAKEALHRCRARKRICCVDAEKDSLYVDPQKWTPARTALIKHAASYPEVERIFVHPGIKSNFAIR